MSVTGPAYVYKAVLHRVVDGDTYELIVDLGFRVQARLMIRLRNYACPELREPKGRAAAEYAQALLAGRTLLVESYKDKQSFARWVADVWIHDDQGPIWVGEQLVEAGLAKRVIVD